jgi:hypothetical protein
VQQHVPEQAEGQGQGLVVPQQQQVQAQAAGHGLAPIAAQHQQVQQQVQAEGQDQGLGAPQPQQLDQQLVQLTSQLLLQLLQHVEAHNQVHFPHQQQQAHVQGVGGAQQVWLQQQVMWILQQLAGVANQAIYEEEWNEPQANLWMQVAQYWLQHLPQSPLLMLLVERLQEELTAWGESSYTAPF